MNLFKNKKVLVTGGTGMVGQQLVPKLIQLGADVNELMKECELPRAEAELMMSLQEKMAIGREK